MKNETTLRYLENLSEKLVLPVVEKEKIENSFKTIKEKLVTAFFDDGLREVKIFGSFDRGTLLSRKVDSESDVDLLIVFDEKKWEPQTYLNKLKQFADINYPRSDNYQDHPTIVLELSSIKFELTPCVYKGETAFVYEKYLIPLKGNSTIEWQKTEPNALKDKISKFVNTKETLIKLILIFKYWNLKNQFAFKTFEVEKFVVEYFNHEEPLDYNFFRLIDKLSTSNPQDEQNTLNKKTKKHKNNMEIISDSKMGEDHILLELNKILPELL
jgi:predicted nucleotidyltransferase